MLEIVLRALFLLAQQAPAPETPKPAQAEPQPVQVKRTDLNLLGATDSAAGESRRNVNGNVLVPLFAERTPLATDPAVARLVQRWIDAYPKALPNRTDVDQRALNTNSPQSIDTDASTIRLDQSVSVRDKILAQHA